MNRTQRVGVIVRHSAQLMSSVSVTTLNKDAVNSPTADSARKIGRNALEVVRDAISNGTASSFAAATAASTRSSPPRKRT